MQAYHDNDADLSILDGRKVAIIGYGNQGNAQGRNMRDSGVDVIVGGVSDTSLERAKKDGFPTLSIPDAASQGDILCLLVPDEIQKEIYDRDIEPSLRSGQTLCFAHGYNIRFGLIRPPASVDVIMVAPRMIGVRVRESYEEGAGSPAFVAVEQDASGRALPTALALCKAIGATRAGVLETTFAEETELDLFMEQGVWPVIVRLLTESYAFLTREGFQPETVLMELYASGEASEIFREMASVGLFRQMAFHSQTSQYGTLSRTPDALSEDLAKKFSHALEAIRNGDFAEEWAKERREEYPRFRRLKEDALSHPINQVEDALARATGKTT